MNRTIAPFLAVAALALGGCTNTLADARDARGKGMIRTYAASFDDVWDAVPQAALEADLALAGSFKDEGYMLFQLTISFAGSVGVDNYAVFVRALDPSRTEVEVAHSGVRVTYRTKILHDELAKRFGVGAAPSPKLSSQSPW